MNKVITNDTGYFIHLIGFERWLLIKTGFRFITLVSLGGHNGIFDEFSSKSSIFLSISRSINCLTD